MRARELRNRDTGRARSRARRASSAAAIVAALENRDPAMPPARFRVIAIGGRFGCV